MQNIYSILWSPTDPSRVTTHHQADWFLEWFRISIDYENAGSLQKPEYSTINFAIHSWLVSRVQREVWTSGGEGGADLPETQPKNEGCQQLNAWTLQVPPMPNNLDLQHRWLPNWTAVWTRVKTGEEKATAETLMFSLINCMFFPLMSGCVTHLKVLFVSAGIHRDAEKKIVVMETAGAEALSVFPSENPPRHIRISTAKKVCWDFILCDTRWFPWVSRAASVPGAGIWGASPLPRGVPNCIC